MKTRNGFTLVELLVVVAVIGILAAVAYPSYTAYVIRGKLAEGTSALSDGRVKMEQFFQDNRTYVGGPAPLATANFTFTSAIPAPTLTTYTITATGTGTVAGFVYTINQNNVKQTTAAPAGWTTAGMPGTPAPCWISKKGGQC
jgi:type IV pilus assembly protein PilE